MWVPQKAHLRLPANAVLSEEIKANGARRYASFDDPQHMVQFLEANKCGSYYEHLEYQAPCFMYFDLDYHDPDMSTEELLCLFIDAFDDYFGKEYNIPAIDIGVNTSISSASREEKLSFHIVVHVKVASVKVMSQLYNEFMMHCASSQEFQLLRHCVDSKVYMQFASMRCVYSHKFANPYLLLPWTECSECIKDHLVRYYENVSPTPCAVIDAAKGVTTDIKCLNIVGTINAAQYASIRDIENTINEEFPSLKEVLNVHHVPVYKSFEFSNTGRHIIILHTSCRPTCPYGNRIHDSNHMFLYFDDRNRYIIIRCHCDEGKAVNKHKTIQSINIVKYRSELYDGTNMTSLHCAEECITWNERYCEDHMHEYPSKSVVCVRANMGVGKTVELRKFLKTKVPRRAKCLMVTFSQTLANKYAEELSSCLFSNYLDYQGTHILNHSRLIVCLDSLYKVAARNVDYLFIDEATSVFLHFNSSYMERSMECSTLLELLLITARHVYLIDACIDHTFMKDIVDYVAEKRKCSAYWIQNTYTRPTNRNATIYTTTNNESGMIKAQSLIDSHLENKKKVVVCSSTKSFTIAIHEHIQKTYPDLKLILCNSNNTEAKNSKEWHTADVLIYSPSITAGVSFELPHFDVLVAFLVNSSRTPTVDISIQQLFRVRQLTDGKMDMVVVDCDKLERPALTSKEIDEFLNKDIMSINKYYCRDFGLTFSSQQVVEDGQLTWDTSRLSYHILKGIIMMKNRSFEYYPLILQNTLREDYNIPVIQEQLVKEDVDVRFEIQHITQKLPPYSEDLHINDIQAEAISNKPSKERTDLETAQQALYLMMKSLKVSRIYAQKLYESFIQDGKVYDRYNAIQTYIKIRKKTPDEIQEQYQSLLTSIKNCKDRNMALYKNKQKNVLKLEIILSKIIQCIGIDKFRSLEPVTIHEDDLTKLVEPHVKDIAAHNRSKSDRPNIAFSWLLKTCFNAAMRRAGTSSKKDKYNWIVISFSNMKTYIDTFYPKTLMDVVTYQPQEPKVEDPNEAPTYNYIDDDDSDIEGG